VSGCHCAQWADAPAIPGASGSLARGAALLIAVALAACGGGTATPSCVELAARYQAALPDADMCDPSSPAPCAQGRPLVVSRTLADGGTAVEGLCAAPCLGAVNPSRTATIDIILKEYRTRDCAFTVCPCPTPAMWPAQCLATGMCTGIAP
jgi:hypothetical protein